MSDSIINLSEVLGSFLSNTFQWLIIAMLALLVRLQGKRLEKLKSGTRNLEDVLAALFGQVFQLPEIARDQCKALIRDVANSINRMGVAAFSEHDARQHLDAVQSFWDTHGVKLRKIPGAESKFRDFERALKAFLEKAGNPSSKAAGAGLKNQFQTVKSLWLEFFNIAFLDHKLDETEIKNFAVLAIGSGVGGNQLFSGINFGIQHKANRRF